MLNDRELKTVCFSVGLFALGAVALILYQHAAHTGAILATVNAKGAPGPMPTASLDTLPSSYASLAGTPIIGQANFAAEQTTNAPTTTGKNWSVH